MESNIHISLYLVHDISSIRFSSVLRMFVMCDHNGCCMTIGKKTCLIDNNLFYYLDIFSNCKALVQYLHL